jgi:large subunit ribosomal protein L32
MAVPKGRVSRMRGRKRRTHWKLNPVNIISCPRCGEPALPHRACPFCGYYKGMKVIEGKIDKEERRRKKRG